MHRELHLTALPGIPEVTRDASLGALLFDAMARAQIKLQAGDILVLAQKMVSKAEGRVVQLASVTPSERAQSIAREANKDPRIVELILRESRKVLRVKQGIIIVEHKLGFVMANAGIDQSNVPGSDEAALLLPEAPDASAHKLCDELCETCGVEVGVLIIDSFGRAWRNGVTGTAIGIAGLPGLVDLRGNNSLWCRLMRARLPCWYAAFRTHCATARSRNCCVPKPRICSDDCRAGRRRRRRASFSRIGRSVTAR